MEAASDVAAESETNNELDIVSFTFWRFYRG